MYIYIYIYMYIYIYIYIYIYVYIYVYIYICMKPQRSQRYRDSKKIFKEYEVQIKEVRY